MIKNIHYSKFYIGMSEISTIIIHLYSRSLIMLIFLHSIKINNAKKDISIGAIT